MAYKVSQSNKTVKSCINNVQETIANNTLENLPLDNKFEEQY